MQDLSDLLQPPTPEQEAANAKWQAEQAKIRKEMESRHMNSAKLLQDKAMERISTLDVTELSPADALKWLEAGIKLETLLRHL